MSIRIAKGYDPLTFEPLAELENYKRDANNAIRSLGLMAEGGTLRQSFFIKGLSEAPFNIVPIYLYQNSTEHYGTDIQLFGTSKKKFISPLGMPELHFYLCSTSTTTYYSFVLNADGEEVLVPHATMDEYLNDRENFINTNYSFITDDDADIQTTKRFDKFIETFDRICNIANYDVDGNLSYVSLFFADPIDSSKRHKVDVLVFASLPFNNINSVDTDTVIGVSQSNLRT